VKEKGLFVAGATILKSFDVKVNRHRDNRYDHTGFGSRCSICFSLGTTVIMGAYEICGACLDRGQRAISRAVLKDVSYEILNP
jgi:hypothetical protein